MCHLGIFSVKKKKGSGKNLLTGSFKKGRGNGGWGTIRFGSRGAALSRRRQHKSCLENASGEVKMCSRGVTWELPEVFWIGFWSFW